MLKVKSSRFSRSVSGSDRQPANIRHAGTRSTKGSRREDSSAVPSGSEPYSSTSSPLRTGNPNTTIGGSGITTDLEPLLSGIVPETPDVMYRLYKDIYHNDAVGGSCVDLMSNLPFGDFSLGGVEDEKILSIFNENIERLSTKSLLPEISTDYLVLGSHTHSLLYSKEKKMFVDLMTYTPENLKFTNLPFYSQDPIITASFSAEARKAITINSPRMDRLRTLIGKEIFDKIASGSLELDPLGTVHIPRKSFSENDTGTSLFRRLVPWYLIEKNLHRGTLVESSRRQRGISHLTVGDGEEWIATPEEMEYISNLFMDADNDPLGAVVATRPGITIDEVRPGGDFWKITDFLESSLTHKLRALGISEAFLNGDASYQTADNSLTIFVDVLRSYRELITRKFFYEKLFPLVSMVNGYTVNSKGKLLIKDEIKNLAPEEVLFKLNDGSSLLIPTISWGKQLKPEGDSAHMEMLKSLTEAGVPVPLRAMAAAGGLNLDELLRQKSDDMSIRKKLQEYQKEIAALAPPAPEEDEGGDEEGETSESTSDVKREALQHLIRKTHGLKSAVIAGRRKKNILDRPFGQASEIVGTTRTGKPKLIIDQRAANERANKRIFEAISATKSASKMSAKQVVVPDSPLSQKSSSRRILL